MARDPLQGGSESPFHESVKVKPGLRWTPRDAGGTRAVRCLQGRAACREWNQTNRENCVVVSRDGKAEL